MTQTNEFNIAKMASQAKVASRVVAQLTTTEKNTLLTDIAAAIVDSSSAILAENEKDISAGKVKGLSTAMLDRLLLTEQRIADISDAIREIVTLTDPVGDISNLALRPNGMQVGKMSILLGVIAMIYEARPNVTAEAAALCIKSGNAVILRGGSEAIHSNLALGPDRRACRAQLEVVHATRSDRDLPLALHARAAPAHLLRGRPVAHQLPALLLLVRARRPRVDAAAGLSVQSPRRCVDRARRDPAGQLPALSTGDRGAGRLAREAARAHVQPPRETPALLALAALAIVPLKLSAPDNQGI